MRSLARITKNLLAAVAVAIPLFSLPIGLVLLVGWPLPGHWPTTREWIAWGTSTHPLTGRVLLDGGACAMWLVWAWYTYHIIGEVLHTLRQIRLPHPTIPVRRQGLVSVLVGSAVLGASRLASALHGGGDAALAAHAVSTPTAAADPHADDPTHHAPRHAVAGATTAWPPPRRTTRRR
jgi:hypothetical protein